MSFHSPYPHLRCTSNPQVSPPANQILPSVENRPHSGNHIHSGAHHSAHQLPGGGIAPPKCHIPPSGVRHLSVQSGGHITQAQLPHQLPSGQDGQNGPHHLHRPVSGGHRPLHGNHPSQVHPITGIPHTLNHSPIVGHNSLPGKISLSLHSGHVALPLQKSDSKHVSKHSSPGHSTRSQFSMHHVTSFLQGPQSVPQQSQVLNLMPSRLHQPGTPTTQQQQYIQKSSHVQKKTRTEEPVRASSSKKERTEPSTPCSTSPMIFSQSASLDVSKAPLSTASFSVPYAPRIDERVTKDSADVLSKKIDKENEKNHVLSDVEDQTSSTTSFPHTKEEIIVMQKESKSSLISEAAARPTAITLSSSSSHIPLTHPHHVSSKMFLPPSILQRPLFLPHLFPGHPLGCVNPLHSFSQLPDQRQILPPHLPSLHPSSSLIPPPPPPPPEEDYYEEYQYDEDNYGFDDENKDTAVGTKNGNDKNDCSANDKDGNSDVNMLNRKKHKMKRQYNFNGDKTPIIREKENELSIHLSKREKKWLKKQSKIIKSLQAQNSIESKKNSSSSTENEIVGNVNVERTINMLLLGEKITLPRVTQTSSNFSTTTSSSSSSTSVSKQFTSAEQSPRVQKCDIAIRGRQCIENDYNQHFVDTGAFPADFIRDVHENQRFLNYPKLSRLMLLKRNILQARGTPAQHIQADLRKFDLASLNMKFDVILIDPPWSEYHYRSGGGASGSRDLPPWSLDELLSLSVENVAENPSFCFLWCGVTHLEDARLLLNKWGFRRCEDICWLKMNTKLDKIRRELSLDNISEIHDYIDGGDVDREIDGIFSEDLGILCNENGLTNQSHSRNPSIRRRNNGYITINSIKKGCDEYYRMQHLLYDDSALFYRTAEHCLMGIKGTVRRSQDVHLIHANLDTDVIIDEEVEFGSTSKPVEMYNIIERFCLGRKRLELFSSEKNIRNGWLSIGTDIPYTNFDQKLYSSWFEGDVAWPEVSDYNGGHYVGSTPEIESLRPKSPPRNEADKKSSGP